MLKPVFVFALNRLVQFNMAVDKISKLVYHSVKH